jgi:hypothetical protein
MDSFSHLGGVRFFLRLGALLVALSTARDFFLATGPRRREVAATWGAIAAL